MPAGASTVVADAVAHGAIVTDLVCLGEAGKGHLAGGYGASVNRHAGGGP